MALSGREEPRGDGSAAPTRWAWRSSLPGEGSRRVLEPGFFRRSADLVARDLLGRIVRSTVGGETVEGVVVETEAYVGPEDPASHAAARIGRTKRNGSMFGPGGLAYVYRSYGIHWCLNVVTGGPGHPAAVLIRALDPLVGISVMRVRRRGREPLASGPGRLGEALGVSGEMDGHPLNRPPLLLLEGWEVPDGLTRASGRVGIREAADWPLRFYVEGHPAVSRGPRSVHTDHPRGR